MMWVEFFFFLMLCLLFLCQGLLDVKIRHFKRPVVLILVLINLGSEEKTSRYYEVLYVPPAKQVLSPPSPAKRCFRAEKPAFQDENQGESALEAARPR